LLKLSVGHAAETRTVRSARLAARWTSETHEAHQLLAQARCGPCGYAKGCSSETFVRLLADDARRIVDVA